MKFAYTTQLMTIKQHTKFQVIPISSFRVLADENFSNVDTLFQVRSTGSWHAASTIVTHRTMQDTTHSSEAAYQISNHSYKWLLRNMWGKLFWDVHTYVQSPINRKLTSDINEICIHDTTHDTKAAYQISNYSHRLLLRNVWRKLFRDVGTYVQSPINRKLTFHINEIRIHDTTHSAKAAYQISNHSYKWLLRNVWQKLFRDIGKT